MAETDVAEKVSATHQIGSISYLGEVRTDSEAGTDPVTMQGHFPLLLGSQRCTNLVLTSKEAQDMDDTCSLTDSVDSKQFDPFDISSSTAASVSDYRSSTELDLPPGLDLHSVGASLHERRQCRPCGWFWKPEGCKNGAACRHCHLCPEDEIKKRKKVKIISMLRAGCGSQVCRSCPVASMSRTPQQDQCNQADVAAVYDVGEPSLNTPSIGSELHGSGQCRPCAWLYKPGGCKNGSQCKHCHLCPDGEIKARRKEKVASLMQKERLEGTISISLSLADALDAPVVPPSRGSILHGTGSCKPCGWFWKAEGCKNGADCNHCHLCPEGTIRSRQLARRRMQTRALTSPGTLLLASMV